MDLKLEGSYRKPLELRDVGQRKVNPSTEVKKESLHKGVEVKSPMMEAMSLLEKLPDVRAEKIALGQRLIARPDYPNDETLEKVADALLGDFDICDE